jgi:hypothetical protein
MSLYPTAGIDKSLNPWCHLIVATIGWIPGILPREESALQVRHHAEMTAVLRTNTRHVIVRAIRVSWIIRIVVFRYHIICALWLRQMELALSVGYPKSKL